MNTWPMTILGFLIATASASFPSQGAPPGAQQSSTTESHDHGYGHQLGSVRFPVSCDAAARASIEEGLALLHHMTYEGAERAFATASAAQPDCAMSYWGQAMTYIHPLWSDPPDATKFERGRALVKEAKRRGKKTVRERAYIAAAGAYYGAGRTGPELRNLVEFERGWQSVHEQFPDDPEAALILSLAQIATADPGDKTFAKQARAGELAEKVLAQVPDHPGAHHYVIHAYDYPPLAERALKAARQYGEVAPEVPHALHMPSHIFTRLGLWPESIAWNKRSAAAALEHPEGGNVSIHYLHALDYMAYAYLQRAEDAQAEQVLELIKRLEGPFTIHSGVAYSLAAVPARLALERQQWVEAAKLEPRTPQSYPWSTAPAIEAITHFARALGAARSLSPAAARESLAKLESLRDEAAKSSAYWAKQVEIQRLSALAWLTFAENPRAAALATMQQAADLEASTEKHPVTPGEVLPARELLADMLLEMGRYDEALTAYNAALARSPNRFNSLYGAGRSAELRDDNEQAMLFYKTLIEQTSGGASSRDRLRRAKAFVAANATAVATTTSATSPGEPASR